MEHRVGLEKFARVIEQPLELVGELVELDELRRVGASGGEGGRRELERPPRLEDRAQVGV